MSGMPQGGIDLAADVELLGQPVKSRDRASRDGSHLHGGALLLDEAKEIVDAPEVMQDSDLGLAVFAEGLDDAEVGAAVGLIALKGGHNYVYT